MEVAVKKIAKATRETPDKVADRIFDAEDKLASIKEKEATALPGEDYSALKAALQKEIAAYEQIQKGERDVNKLTADWEGTPAVKATPSVEQSTGRLLTTIKEPLDALSTNKQKASYLYKELKTLLNRNTEDTALGKFLTNKEDGALDTARYLEYISNTIRSFREDKTISPKLQEALEGMSSQAYKAFEHTYKEHVVDAIDRQPIEATVPKYADMVSLLEDVDAPLIENLRNNEQLFNKVGNLQMDQRLSGTVQKIVSHFINVTGLGKDDIYVLAMDRQTPGALNHVGNTSIIKLDINKINEMAASSDTAGVSFGGMVGKKLTDAKNTYAQVRVAAHEIGHILFNKYMQNFITDGAMYADLLRKWDTYKKTSKFENVSLFDFDGGKRSASLLERQKYFHEFFAEQVTKELIHKHTLGAFVKGSKIFEPLIQASRDILKKAGIDVDNKTFATTIIQDIIAKNEESIKATGETIFEKQERLNADQALTGQAPLFSQKTLQEMVKHSRDSGFLPSKGRTSEALMALDIKDLPMVSSRMIHALGKGSGFLARKFFGKIAVKEMQMKDGAVQNAYWQIRRAEEYSEAVVNRLWNGDVKPSAVGFTDVLSKVKASDSVFVTLTKATYNDLATLHDVFNKGLQEGLEYADNLKQNGQHLTPEQVKYYNSIADLYTKMYDESAKLQQDLGKKWVLPKKAGWFQSVRSGNYAVTISFGDIMAHRQHFQTQLQAEKFLQKLKESGLKHLEVSEVIDTRKQPAQSNKQMADIIREALSKDFPHGKEAFEDRINSILDSMNVRGGKLGQHHKYRFNVPGYKGTEFFKSKEELGKSFKEAIEYAIAEKGNQLKQMQIDHQLKTLLEEGTLKTEKPESYAAIQQMYDSTLGRNEALFDGSKIDYTADKVLDSVYNVFGKEYAVDKSAARSVYEGIKESFYLTKMMPKMIFSIIGQVLSVPPGTISHLSYGGHGARAYLSFAKGLTKLSLGDKALWKAIKEDSQQYNVFEPAFIEAMSLQDSSKPVYKAFKDYVLMQAPGKAMDSVSRVMTYAIAKTHFTDLGMSENVAREQARFATGKILNLYDKANAAPVFSHLGGIGDVVQPLMGFGQNALGSLIAAVKHVSPKDYRTWGPLVNYTLVTIATSGIMGMQFIQEYEQFRRYINKNFNDFTLPSILDIFASDDGFLNRLTPLSEQERQTAMYGVPSLSGLDLASSVRANETFPTLIAGLVGGWTQPNETMAMLSWAASVPGAMVDIGQAVSGNKSLADTRKPFDGIAPAGHPGYAAKKAIGLENTNVLGGTTDMLAGGSKATAYAKEQPIDVAAGIMGGKTTQRRWDEQRDFETAEKEQNLSAKKDRAGVLYVETGNPKFIDKMVELGMTEKQIVSKIELELHNRLTPQEIRLIANKAGKVVKGSGERKAIQLFKFGQKE